MDLSLTALLRRRAEAGSSGDRTGAGRSASGLEALLRRRFARRVGLRFSAALVILLAWGILVQHLAGWLYGVERQRRDLEAQAAAADQDLQRLLALAQEAAAPQALPPLPQIDPAPVGGTDPFAGGAVTPQPPATMSTPAPVVPGGTPAPPQGTVKAETPRPPAVEVAGIGGGGDRFFAVLVRADGTSWVVQAGDQVDGWRVAAVAPGAVTLEKEAHRTVLERREE